jgi:hypothetical protein
VTPEAKSVLEYQIGEVLKGFQVHLHYNGSAGTGVRRYAVWDGRLPKREQVTEPAAHAQAQADRVRLQTEAIIQLIEETVP